MNPPPLLPVQRAAELSLAGPQIQWLIEGLWTEQAVGILGGEPKCCKSFLALDMALSVASGAPCLRQFPVTEPGTVLIFPAEDSLAVVRQRLEGICAAADLALEKLPLEVITAPVLRLDREEDRLRLRNTIKRHRPRLLVLDPLIRLHRVDENDASQMAELLSFLRELQRQFGLAVVVVHHARKDSKSARPGQALRGSSELHGWGDSNLYLRRLSHGLTLCTEHRAAASSDPMALKLVEAGPALSLALVVEQDQGAPSQSKKPTALQRVVQALEPLDHPVSLRELRQRCGMRTASVSSALNDLRQQGVVTQKVGGYQLQVESMSVSASKSPIDPAGNGNGKQRVSDSGP